MGKLCAIAESRDFRIDIGVEDRFEASMAFGQFFFSSLGRGWVWDECSLNG